MNQSRYAGACMGLALFAVASVRAGEILCFEAEDLSEVTDPMVVVRKTSDDDKALQGASGQACLAVPAGKGNPPEVTTGSAVLAFEIKEAGTYYLWCRAWWDDECSNSFTMNIDRVIPFAFGQDATYKSWHWVKAPPGLKQLQLTAGRHTLTIRNREDGVKIDQILLTNDRKYVPVDIEKVTAVSPPPDGTQP